MYEKSGSDVDYIKDYLKGENKKNSKENSYTNMDEKKEGKQADLLKLKKKLDMITMFQEKREKMRKLWSRMKWSCHTLGKTFS